MKNLKKLDREQLKTISGEGLFDPVLGAIGGILGGVGQIVGGTVGAVGGAIGGTVVQVIKNLENGLCEVQCGINNVVHVTVVSCGSQSCK
ncbi:Blp family class II bacteriocin [Chryseobacterium sp. NRRL B-14859]|uniref:Blp family class II bacteriocin n=1 Tax=unclassified Chryseobacterium TaxID=2593645 RepID=UPI000F45B721|nr:Blp family class II bacteriocin [Chryseobacterium sp. G0240]ROI05806.1 hypothetical protein EGI16_05345 [Chryseobacterium sp. G0240]